MNTIEATQLVALLSRAGLMQPLEGQADVWALALDDVRVQDALEGARSIIRTRTGAERWVTPGDVRAAVRKLREARLNDQRAIEREVPPSVLDDDPARAMAWMREYRHQIADGADPQAADAHACHVFGVASEYHRMIDGGHKVPPLRELMPRPPHRDERPQRKPETPDTPIPDRDVFLKEVQAQMRGDARHGRPVSGDPVTG